MISIRQTQTNKTFVCFCLFFFSRALSAKLSQKTESHWNKTETSSGGILNLHWGLMHKSNWGHLFWLMLNKYASVFQPHLTENQYLSFYHLLKSQSEVFSFSKNNNSVTLQMPVNICCISLCQNKKITLLKIIIIFAEHEKNDEGKTLGLDFFLFIRTESLKKTAEPHLGMKACHTATTYIFSTHIFHSSNFSPSTFFIFSTWIRSVCPPAALLEEFLLTLHLIIHVNTKVFQLLQNVSFD